MRNFILCLTFIAFCTSGHAAWLMLSCGKREQHFKTSYELAPYLQLSYEQPSRANVSIAAEVADLNQHDVTNKNRVGGVSSTARVQFSGTAPGLFTNTVLATQIKITPHEFPALDFGSPGNLGINGSRGGLPSQVFTCYRDDTHKFAFIHIPKNAGSALSNYMNELLCAVAGKIPGCGLKVKKGHCPSDPSYFIFTFTRNPWDRAVSMWSYGLKKRQLGTKDLTERKRLAYAYCTFDEFVDDLAKNTPKGGCGAHVGDKQYPSIYMRDGRPGVHFAGRLEHFDRDFKIILERIDTSGRMLEYYKKTGFTMHNDSGHKHYTTYYKNQKMKDAVASYYAMDTKLGYKFETYQETITPARYHDGKAAADLNYGDVRDEVSSSLLKFGVRSENDQFDSVPS